MLPPVALIFKLLLAVAAELTPLHSKGNNPTASLIKPSASVSKPISIVVPVNDPKAVNDVTDAPVGIKLYNTLLPLFKGEVVKNFFNDVDFEIYNPIISGGLKSLEEIIEPAR